MAGKGALAAEIARNCAAKTNSAEYTKLSGLMCWDAVAHIALLAGIVDDTRYKGLKGNPETLVKSDDPRIDSGKDMVSLGEGEVLGFYESGSSQPIHVMISTGGGRAAGNKNDCVGVGHAVGWEVLDLADQLSGLTWASPGIKAPKGVTPAGKKVMRDVFICHRSIESVG